MPPFNYYLDCQTLFCRSFAFQLFRIGIHLSRDFLHGFTDLGSLFLQILGFRPEHVLQRNCADLFGEFIGFDLFGFEELFARLDLRLKLFCIQLCSLSLDIGNRLVLINAFSSSAEHSGGNKRTGKSTHHSFHSYFSLF